MQADNVPVFLFLGLLFLAGLAADLVARRLPIPRVTLLILIGLAAGPAGFDLLPRVLVDQWFPPLTTLALSMVGFLLGHNLSLQAMRKHGRLVVAITIGETTGALLLVTAVLLLFGTPPVPAKGNDLTTPYRL